MSLYRRPLRSDELMHAGGHKYIDRIRSGKGWRYFYSMDELKAFKEGAVNKVRGALGGDAKHDAKVYAYRANKAINDKAEAHKRASDARKKGEFVYAARQELRRAENDVAEATRLAKASREYYRRTPLGMAENAKKKIVRITKKANHSFDQAREDAINRIGGAKDRVAKALRLRETAHGQAVRNNTNARYAREDARSQSAADRITNERREAVARKNTNARYAREDAQSNAAAARIEESNRRNDVRRNNSNSRMSKENTRSQQTGQRSSVTDRIGRNANLAGRNLSNAVRDAGNAISKGYDNDVRKPLTRVTNKTTTNAKQAGRNLSDAARDARNTVVEGTKRDTKRIANSAIQYVREEDRKAADAAKKVARNSSQAARNLSDAARDARNAVTSDAKKRRDDISRASKSGADYVSKSRSTILNNINQARDNVTSAARDAKNAVSAGYDRDVKKPASKVASNARQAGQNLVGAFRDAGDAIARGYDEDIRKRRKKRR